MKHIRTKFDWFAERLNESLSESESESENEDTENHIPNEMKGDIEGSTKRHGDATHGLRVNIKNEGEYMDESVEVPIAQEERTTDRETSILHEIEFQDEGENFLDRRRWKGPFDLVEARKGVEGQARKTIAEITTILVTNINEDDSRSGRVRRSIAKAGFLRNPRIEFKGIKQKMVVRSRHLIEVLRKLVHYYPSINLQADALVLESPFCVLVHHIDELENYKDKLEEKDDLTTDGKKNVGLPPPPGQGMSMGKGIRVTVDHIKKILYFMKTNLFGNQIEDEKARHLQDPPVCTFSMMWLLYKPGTTVYVRDAAGKASAYVMERFEVGDTVSAVLERSEPYYVKLWYLGFDGKFVRRFNRNMAIGSFDGERPIIDLKIIPAAILDALDEGKTRKSLVARGRKWFRMLVGAQQWQYSSHATSQGNKTIDTRVVIDTGSFLRGRPPSDFGDMGKDLPICPCEICLGYRPHPPKGFPWAEYDLIDAEHAELELPDAYEDKDHRYLLCSGVVRGFDLKSRTWGNLDVEQCRPATINTNAINTLVMPDERKRMIMSAVQKYKDPMFKPGRSASTWGADFIQTKGEGQIFLLHGGPGVGKTYTAECISELIGRPLLSLTCADFGTNEEDMEKRLSSWFKLAESWGAVMVLDEADVWLERQMIADLKRNTLVAVFLRCLEYYRGILFLTTNRVGTFDDAFISRIHLVIHYEELGEPQRKQIWKQFFDKLERERRDDIIVESRAKHFVLNDSEMKKIPWNGREIRNVFQTAVSLAEYRFHYEGGKMESDKIVLDKVDFEQVCQMSVEFKEYLTKVHKGDDENDRAMRDRARA